MSEGREEGIIVISDGLPGGISEIFPKDDENELRKNTAKVHGMTVSDCDVNEEKRDSKKGKACK